MTSKRNNGRIARDKTFDEFLDGQGLLADAEDAALKELIAEQLRSAMVEQGVTRTTLASRMQSS